MPLLEPDRLFARITAIDIERDLLGAGFKAVLLDIDNTLRSRATGEIPRDAGVWLAKARDAGVRFCLLSNNWHDDVFQFAESLGLPIVAKAMKPLPFGYLSAIRKLNGWSAEMADDEARAVRAVRAVNRGGGLGGSMNDPCDTSSGIVDRSADMVGECDGGPDLRTRITRRNTVAVGDQLFTDVVGAHLAGIAAYMVAPLAEVDLKHTLMLRNLEHRLIGTREPEPVATCNAKSCQKQ